MDLSKEELVPGDVFLTENGAEWTYVGTMNPNGYTQWVFYNEKSFIVYADSSGLVRSSGFQHIVIRKRKPKKQMAKRWLRIEKWNSGKDGVCIELHGERPVARSGILAIKEIEIEFEEGEGLCQC